MSFKKWSSAQTAAAEEKSDDKSKSKDAPAADQPPTQPDKTPTEAAPVQKS